MYVVSYSSSFPVFARKRKIGVKPVRHNLACFTAPATSPRFRHLSAVLTFGQFRFFTAVRQL